MGEMDGQTDSPRAREVGLEGRRPWGGRCGPWLYVRKGGGDTKGTHPRPRALVPGVWGRP